MPKINVLKPFAFAHRGCDVEHFEVGPADTTDECAELAVSEGWAEPMADSPPPPPPPESPSPQPDQPKPDDAPAESQLDLGAPENADAAGVKRGRKA